MINAFVVGCNGTIGKAICDLINNSKEFTFSNGIGYDNLHTSYKNTGLSSVKDLEAHASWLLTKDVFIDASDSQATMDVLPFAVRYEIPMVIINSAYFTSGKKAVIKGAARKIPIIVLDKKMLKAEERNMQLVLHAVNYIIKQQNQIREQSDMGQQVEYYIYTVEDMKGSVNK